MGILTSLLALVVVFGLLAWVLTIYWRRVVDAAITQHFREAEAISNGWPPRHWIIEINRKIALRRTMGPLVRQITGSEFATWKIDRLHRFFVQSPFFEDATARDELLSQLRETRERWATMTWEAISHERFEECDRAAG